jgi:6-phosphogluconolactonase
MADVQVESSAQQVAAKAAAIGCEALNRAIEGNGQASWVLAGGRSPMAAYRLITANYASSVDWSKVTVLLGDERCVAVGHPDSNWQQIKETLLDGLNLPEKQQLRPPTELGAEGAAKDYSEALKVLFGTPEQTLRLDHLWLGMGEDGHTLSLFPRSSTLQEAKDWVVVEHNSPKPPPERISLSLAALKNVGSCLIQVTGSEKAQILTQAINGDSALPIVQAVKAIEAGGGQVTWIIDTAAAAKL